MRALTIRQPWAALIMMGRKRIETRSTTTKRRGRVAIHAAVTMGRAEREAAVREGLDPDSLPRGVILGTVEIVDAKPAEELTALSDFERRCGDYGPGRWGWMLVDARPIETPIEASGALSFWQVPTAAAAAVEAQEGDRVFVYGTLKRGHWNHRLLEKGRARFIGTDRIGGTMHDLAAFPAVTLAGNGAVHGEVYEVDAVTLARLDQLEGTPSFYQRTRVRMSSGTEAWVYTMAPDKVACARVVHSGKWER